MVFERTYQAQLKLLRMTIWNGERKVYRVPKVWFLSPHLILIFPRTNFMFDLFWPILSSSCMSETARSDQFRLPALFRPPRDLDLYRLNPNNKNLPCTKFRFSFPNVPWVSTFTGLKNFSWLKIRRFVYCHLNRGCHMLKDLHIFQCKAFFCFIA